MTLQKTLDTMKFKGGVNVFETLKSTYKEDRKVFVQYAGKSDTYLTTGKVYDVVFSDGKEKEMVVVNPNNKTYVGFMDTTVVLY